MTAWHSETGNCRAFSPVFCVGSEDESKDGEKQSRKRRHKSISPIVYDKESSGSESESSEGSEGKL